MSKKIFLNLYLFLGLEFFNNFSLAMDLDNHKFKKNLLKVDTDSFFDESFDYSKLSGRVTDRDATASIIKVSSENKNIRFFRAGDLVKFKIQNQSESDFCEGHVRSNELNYFVLFVKDIYPCFKNQDFLRRGSAIVMESSKLAERIREASIYRASIINRKKDFLIQLNSINTEVWNFEEQKVKVATEFDEKIAKIQSEKIKALDALLSRRIDLIRLQKELAYRLDGLDEELKFYKLEKDEPLFDRWHKDQDLGLPVIEKPEPLR